MAATASLEASAVNRDKPEAVGQLSDNRDLAKDHVQRHIFIKAIVVSL